ncbi:flagellar biosynthetic protein FliO [Hoeflea sp. G2-23]|uniref:Flagellar biosynthetic protein FliO n=1 Tax=Hoeflea algicola TaxID=2983763 RepID=A0ABT3Z6F0_9HYPH|nr:flagellar biosynthetic protein FliO [Hoeflea algicola]MCY0147284.1 flagellar biosynthetic protein FliO [Hoeflea algicola]
MPDNILDGHGATLLIAVIVVAVALLALVGVFRLIRGRTSSTFVRGGRGRQPRLAVLDAAAVDTRRRIVLIRRDDVEHLVMIGGPTDVVIESRITRMPDEPADTRPVAPARMPTPVTMADPAPRAAASAAPAPVAQQQSRTARPQPAARPQPTAAPREARPSDSARPAPSPQAAIAATVTTATAVGSVQADAADALETARARVFDEPDFSDTVLDEVPPAPITAPTSVDPSLAARQAEPASNPEIELPGYSEVLADQADSSSSPDPAQPSEPARTPVPAAGERSAPAGDFESVLAAELSEDLSLDGFDDGFLDSPDQGTGPLPDVEPVEPPEVKPDTSPSRDSLEAEMARLLGDLSRKPS